MNLEVPRELRWIGPLFAVLYFILWSTHSTALLVVITREIWVLLLISLLLIPIVLLLVFLGSVNRYRFAALILFLSLFFSGFLVEFIPIPSTPYYGPYPQPPGARPLQPPQLVSPFWALFSLMINSSNTYGPTSPSSFLGLLLLVLLAVLTAIVTGLVSTGKIDVVQAMLFLVSLMVCWTFTFLPLGSFMGSNSTLTPFPLGPLVALNILPWIPKSETKTKLNPNQWG